MVLSNRDFALQASADAHKAHSALQLNQIVRRYSGGRGLGPVSLNVNWGQVCSVIGANGSGKTTLLRCIGLFEPLNSGSIELSGKAWSAANAVSQITDEERGSLLGIVFQHAEPWPHLSILDNVKLPLIHVARLSPQESRERAEQELERFGLADRAKALSHQLSGGMRQRVALARTFALRPKLLLLDEATSALDPEWSERVRQIMRGFADAGGAIISISHRLNFVRRLSDWVIYLSNGQIVEEGAPHSILDNPRDTGLQMFLENA